MTFSLIGAGAWVLLKGGMRDTRPLRRAVAVGGLVIGLAIAGAGTAWLLSKGTAETPPRRAAAPARSINMPDPSAPGSYPVLTLSYGSGSDRRRAEFGEGAALKTRSVDGTAFIGGWDGPTGWARSAYWGIDAKTLPLNGRVWYPDGEGPFPLALVVHGNQSMEDFSDLGYDYLGELLASRGFILVPVDENFLNGSITDAITGPTDGLKEENDARGWLLLEHLKVWREWNGEKGNPFYGKVDLENIAVMGHSRGGEAAYIAAAFNRLPYYPDNATVKFDYGFNIRAVVSIAPVDGQYRPAEISTPLENVNFSTLQGTHDGDMRSFHGSRMYERVKFTDGEDWFKSYIYIYGANHGQFNTTWGRDDLGGLRGWFLNQRNILPKEAQERIAKVFISAFLEAALHGETGYLPLFQDHRAGAAWLPETIYLNQFQASGDRFVSTFDEDIDVTTTSLPGGETSSSRLTLWREQQVMIKWGSKDTRAAYLGWAHEANGTAVYRVRLPEGGMQTGEGDALIFSLADTGENPNPAGIRRDRSGQGTGEEEDEAGGEKEPLDLTIVLVDGGGKTAAAKLSSVSPLQRQLGAQVMKAAVLNNTPVAEVVFQSYEMPLASFVPVGDGFDPGKVTEIRFVFDQSPEGVVALDDVGFRSK